LIFLGQEKSFEKKSKISNSKSNKNKKKSLKYINRPISKRNVFFHVNVVRIKKIFEYINDCAITTTITSYFQKTIKMVRTKRNSHKTTLSNKILIQTFFLPFSYYYNHQSQSHFHFFTLEPLLSKSIQNKNSHFYLEDLSGLFLEDQIIQNLRRTRIL